MSKIQEIIKEFKLTTWAVNNKTSVYVIVVSAYCLLTTRVSSDLNLKFIRFISKQ